MKVHKLSLIEDTKAWVVALRRLVLPKGMEDIPLLPSTAHVVLVSLAALVGLLAGLAATFLRVLVHLVSGVFMTPHEFLALLLDDTSPVRLRLYGQMQETPLNIELIILGMLTCGSFTAFGCYRQWLRRKKEIPQRHEEGETTPWSRALIIALVLMGALFFYFLIFFLKDLAEAVLPHHTGIVETMKVSPLWALCLAALAGGLGVVLISRLEKRSFGESGIGVPDILESVAKKEGRIEPLRGTALASKAAITAAAGGSAGLEGPVVVFGASTASGLAQTLHLPRDRMRVLVAAGAAAGIAASFNAPMAGALFALEIIVGDFALATFSPVVIASVIGTVVSRAIQGDHAVLSGMDFNLVSSYEMGLYVLLGLFCGIMGSFFVKMLEAGPASAERLLKPIPKWLWPSAGMMILVVIGSLFGRLDILGTGYDAMRSIQGNDVELWAIIGLLIGKMLATTVTLASGGAGGIFFPTLFVGAATGNLFGQGANVIFGELVALPGSYALIGMGATVAAVQQAPLTAMVMLFELTNDYTIMLPLMIACIVATLLAKRALGENYYQRVLRQRGVVLFRGRDQNVLRTVRVHEVMEREVVTLKASTTLRRIIPVIEETNAGTFPVVNDAGELSSILSLQDLRKVMFEPGLQDLVVAGELGVKKVITIGSQDTLALALSRMALQPFEHIVVVDSENPKKVIGLLSRHAILLGYRRAVQKTGLFVTDPATLPPP
jgi:CIC family chloride channel protein